MEEKKRDWKDCRRFSGSEKSHLVSEMSWALGAPWDVSHVSFAGSIQMLSRCSEWQEKGITTSLGMNSYPWSHPSRAVPVQGLSASQG